MYDEPTSEWSERDVPPVSMASQKLMRLPSVTNGKRIVCLSPTVCAPFACSSSRHPPRTCAPEPIDAPSRKTASWANPPLSSTFLPSRQFSIVIGVSAPRIDPDEMTVREPRIRHPGWMTTPSALMRSGSTSSVMSTVLGLGISTPLAMSASTVAAPRLSISRPFRAEMCDGSSVSASTQCVPDV